MSNLPRLNDGSLAAYTWPGGYPVYYICEDAGCIFVACADCASKIEKEFDDIRIIESDINWEEDDLYCEECNAQIECAYI